MFFVKNVVKFDFNDTEINLSDFRIQVLEESYPRHYHSENSYEIHYFPYGKGKMIIDDIPYDIIPNTLIITGPFVNHEQIPNEPLTKYSVYLTIKKSSEDSLLSLFLDKKYYVGIDNYNCFEILKKIEEELKNPTLGYKINVESLVKMLIVSIIRNYNNKSVIEDFDENEDIVFKIEAIFLNEFKSITINDMANRVYMSVRQLQRFLKKHYKKTFNTLKLEYRMNYAIYLLNKTNMKIEEISSLCGYSSSEHFSEAFKKKFNKTPLKYRKESK
ncbi:MAG: helix-turn-helix domain-containing protein [Anaeroplasmataceae bacterium]